MVVLLDEVEFDISLSVSIIRATWINMKFQSAMAQVSFDATTMQCVCTKRRQNTASG